MDFLAFILFGILVLAVNKGWRYFLETSEDLDLVRKWEPWYWFLFSNLLLFLITTQYDYRFVAAGLLVQTALSGWFALSMGWLIARCPHKTGVMEQSLFSRGRSLKFCDRCGTRLSKEVQTHLISARGWAYFLFRMPPRLVEYVLFWMVQSSLVMVSLFIALKCLRRPEAQYEAVSIAVAFVVLAPPLVHSFGKFRGVLAQNRGLLWWQDLKGFLLFWALAALALWLLLGSWGPGDP